MRRGDRDHQRGVAHDQVPKPMAHRYRIHGFTGCRLLYDALQHLVSRRVTYIAEVAHTPTSVVIADHPGESDDGACGLVRHQITVLADVQWFVRDRGAHHAATGCLSTRGVVNRRGGAVAWQRPRETIKPGLSHR